MPNSSEETQPDLLNARGPDGGPLYTETDLNAPIVEPWNTASAALFVLIAAWWMWRLRGRFSKYPFLTGCLPILLVGGIGGTVYHATRSAKAWFLMDVIPIAILAMAAAVYIWVRLRPQLWLALLAITLTLALQCLRFLQGLDRQWMINISYGSLAGLVLLPIGIALVRTRFRDAGWVGTALACFVIAWFCRIADAGRPEFFPMGTHWLWHTFGALATASLTEYFYRIEGYTLRRATIEQTTNHQSV